MSTGGEGARDSLAVMRTRMASERTLMAWVRTATSLIAFGFGIPRFFAELGAREGVRAGAGPAHMGLFLASLGVLVVVVGTLQHTLLLRRIGGGRAWSMATAIALLLGAAGLYALYKVARFAEAAVSAS